MTVNMTHAPWASVSYDPVSSTVCQSSLYHFWFTHCAHRYIIFNPSLNFMYCPWFLFLTPSSLTITEYFLIYYEAETFSLVSDQCILSFYLLILWIITFFHLYRYLRGIYRLQSNPPQSPSLDYINVYDPISHPIHYWYHFCPSILLLIFH